MAAMVAVSMAATSARRRLPAAVTRQKPIGKLVACAPERLMPLLIEPEAPDEAKWDKDGRTNETNDDAAVRSRGRPLSAVRPTPLTCVSWVGGHVVVVGGWWWWW